MMANEVPIPPQALSDPRAFELFRVWFANNKMYMGLGRSFDEPSLWGVVLAAVAQQAAGYYASDPSVSEQETLMAIKQQFDDECDAALKQSKG